MSKSTNVIFYIFIFVNMWPMRTIVKDEYTQTETAKPIALAEILQIFQIELFSVFLSSLFTRFLTNN